MRQTLPLLIATLLLPVATHADNTPVYHRVDFSTEVSRVIPNDLMQATLSIELSDRDPARLAQQLTQAMNDAQKKAAAYPAVKVSSGNQHTWPVYGSSLTSSSKLESWRGRSELRLESRDFKAAGELIAKLQEKLQMNGVSFTVAPETRRQLEGELTQQAIATFRQRADLIREGWQAKGYKLVQMNIGQGGGGMPVPVMMRSMKAMDASESMPAQELAGGETHLTINASGSIELLP
ncbi:MAG: SIMPL domain-containing protein [Moraxellaceae bacterium]